MAILPLKVTGPIRATVVETVGQIEVRTLTKGERMVSGGKGLAIGWGLALFSVLIPVLHFVLVPLFFLVGPALFFILYFSDTAYENGSGVCPECQKTFKIVAARSVWPWNDVCEHCRARLKIEKRDPV